MERFEVWFGGLFPAMGPLAPLIFGVLSVTLARAPKARPYRRRFSAPRSASG